MDSHQIEQSTNGRSAARYTYPTGVYCPLALDRLESFQFSGYQNKRQQQTLFNMSANQCFGIALQRYNNFLIRARNVLNIYIIRCAYFDLPQQYFV